MKLDEHLDHLADNEHFRQFLDHIWEIRESEIQNLKDSEVTELERLSGSISALDDILNTANYDVRNRYML